MVELLPYICVMLTKITLVCLDDVHHHFGVLFLFIFGHAGVGEHSLPVFGQALTWSVNRTEVRICGLQ